MEGIKIDIIATPGQCLPICTENDSRQVFDWARRTVVAGNPFGSCQSHLARLNRDDNVGMPELSRSL